MKSKYHYLNNIKPDVDSVIAADFDSFWTETIEQSCLLMKPYSLNKVATSLKNIDCYELEFSGYMGQQVFALINVPIQCTTPQATVIQYVGYGGGCGINEEHTLWPSLGYVHVIMDNRGQGCGWSGGPGSIGRTSDTCISNSYYPGFLTKGITNKEHFYYRRLITDAAMLITQITSLNFVDEQRIAVLGHSQGGALALAASSLTNIPKLAAIDAPFLNNIPHALEHVKTEPYLELINYLKVHKDEEEVVLNTLSYFDGIGFSLRSNAKLLFSVGLMDDICPPDCVMAVYNNHNEDKDIIIYPYSGHEMGEWHQVKKQIQFFNEYL